MDPSAGASVFFGLAVVVREEREQIYSITDLLLGKPFAPQRNHLLADLDLLPATKRLAYLADDLSKKDLGVAEGGGRLLAESLVRVETEYDYVIIDTQPTLNRLLIMALLDGATGCPQHHRARPGRHWECADDHGFSRQHLGSSAPHAKDQSVADIAKTTGKGEDHIKRCIAIAEAPDVIKRAFTQGIRVPKLDGDNKPVVRKE
jgi:hypothetical protein